MNNSLYNFHFQNDFLYHEEKKTTYGWNNLHTFRCFKNTLYGDQMCDISPGGYIY